MFVTYQKGEIARMKVLLRAAEKGIVVCVPTVEARYDLVMEIDGTLHRVQVKYTDCMTKCASGSVFLDLRKETRNNGKKRPYTKKEVDLILVYVLKTDTVVCLEPKHFHNKHSLTLRYDVPANNQKKNVHLISEMTW